MVTPLGFDSQDFSNSHSTELNLTTGVVTILGPDDGSTTLLAQIDRILADNQGASDSGFTVGFEPDDAEY